MKKWNHVIESRISLAVLAFGLASSMQAQGLHNPTGSANALNNARPHDDHGDNGNNDNNGNRNKTSPTPPGLYITPKALADAVQQDLNPGLAKYPDFVAGQAVKAVASPDGKTLAILTAGMNSLYDSTGVIDKGASTQFLFLYDVSGANKTNPVLKQVIQQLNAHVGLVSAPNSQTLYAADDRRMYMAQGEIPNSPCAILLFAANSHCFI
jgi:hypothetical protein